MNATRIEWTEHTWNPIIGCRRRSPGCENCYAERMAARLAAMPGPVGALYRHVVNAHGRWTGRQIFLPEVMSKVTRSQKPRMIFAGSMSDWFVDIRIVAVFACMNHIRWCSQHTFQLLTKRPADAAKFQGRFFFDGFPPNLWLGTSVENNATYYRIERLREVNAAVRFVSFEPMLEPIRVPVDLVGMDWVIIGCETGPGRRPMDLAWAEELAASAKQQGIPVFVKGLNIDGRVVKDPAHPQWPVWVVRRGNLPVPMWRNSMRTQWTANPGRGTHQPPQRTGSSPPLWRWRKRAEYDNGTQI